jgi:hypothetical protein
MKPGFRRARPPREISPEFRAVADGPGNFTGPNKAIASSNMLEYTQSKVQQTDTCHAAQFRFQIQEIHFHGGDFVFTFEKTGD